MKIAAISDLHGYLPAIPKCDVLLIAGDICPLADHAHWAQSQFLTHDFAKWREGIDVKSVIYIAGNHDWIFERDRVGAQRWKERLQADRAPGESCYLQDDYCVLNDLKIYGFRQDALGSPRAAADAARRAIPPPPNRAVV